MIYNLNNRFKKKFSPEEYYPQDICDRCIDEIIGKIWFMYDLSNPYDLFDDNNR